MLTTALSLGAAVSKVNSNVNNAHKELNRSRSNGVLANTEFPYNICAFYDSNSSGTVPTTKGVNFMNISTYFPPE